MIAEPETIDATECNTMLQTVSHRQELAINALVLGLTDAEAADRADVHRVTVTRWRLYDDVFRKALADRLSQVWETCLFHLRTLVPRAIETIHQVLECGDDGLRLKAALELMKLIARFHSPSVRGPIRELDGMLPDEVAELRERELFGPKSPHQRGEGG